MQRHGKPYAAVPPGRLSFGTVLWLVGGLAVVGSLLSLVFFTLTWNAISSHRSYVGELSPESDPVVVTLPEGAMLGKTLVGRNETVKRGQTLATLDVDAMNELAGKLEEELLRQGLLRDCLLANGSPGASQKPDVPEDVQTVQSLALEECRDLLADETEIQERLERTRATMLEERSVVERHIAFLAPNPDRVLSKDQIEANARRALALALLRSRIDARIAAIELQTRRELSAVQDRKIRRVSEVTDAINENSKLRRRLRMLVEEPRILAPEAGRVVRVRAVQSSSPFQQAVDLIEMRPDHHTGYRAFVDVSETLAEGIDPGDQVTLQLFGPLSSSLRLGGEVSSLGAEGGTMIRVEISLDAESIATLDDPKVGIALRGEGTASVVRVRKNEFSAIEGLQVRLVQALAPSLNQAFVVSVMRTVVAAIPFLDRPGRTPSGI